MHAYSSHFSPLTHSSSSSLPLLSLLSPSPLPPFLFSSLPSPPLLHFSPSSFELPSPLTLPVPPVPLLSAQAVKELAINVCMMFLEMEEGLYYEYHCQFPKEKVNLQLFPKLSSFLPRLAACSGLV
ncbi:unnamed protein product [Closterium sp. NIES-65]|nr:unnamed protein product [Closterium sp. NIES-65]